MKNLLWFVLALPFSNVFSQHNTFENSDKPVFDSGFKAIIHDSSGYFYAVGSTFSSVGLDNRGFIAKFDQGGTFQYLKYLSIAYEDVYLHDLQWTNDGNIFICGVSNGCDFGDISALVMKVNINGDTLWTKKINTKPVGTVVDNYLSKIVSLDNGNTLFAADSTIYVCNNFGDSLFTISTNEKINWINEGFDKKIICGVNSGIIVLDSLGQYLSGHTFPSSISFAEKTFDSTYLINSGNILIKLDSTFSTIGQLDLSQINFSAIHLFIDSAKIWVCNYNGSDFACFDLNLQLIDSFRTQASEVIINSFTVADTIIMVCGFETSHKNNSYLKSYSTNGHYTYYPVDIALTGISFDTAFVDQPAPLPSGVYRINFLSRLTVENTGLDTIHSFYVNAQSFILNSPCGIPTYSMLKTNLNLLPGQTLTFTIDTISEFGLSISHFPYAYGFCPWLSSPNFMVDKNHLNDYLCDTVIAEAPNSIEQLDPWLLMQIYPNPTSNRINIELPYHYGAELKYELFDVSGNELSSGIFYKKQNSLEFSGFSAGAYFLKLVSKNKMVVRKIFVY